MKHWLLILRWSLVAVALVLAFITFVRAIGVDNWPCDEYCTRIRDWPLSPFVSLLAIGGLLAMGYSLSKQNEKAFRGLAWSGVGVALLLQLMSISWQAICVWCMALAFVVLGLGLTTISAKKWALVSLVPVVFGLLLLYDAVAPPRQKYDPIEFTYRPYEVQPVDFRQRPYVIYADPECSACRRLAREEAKFSGDDIVFYYRWYLLPATSGRTLRAATAIEAVSIESAEYGERFRQALFEAEEKLTDETILQIASNLGLEATVRGALDNPPKEVLSWISDDGRAFESARHFVVPQPARLDAETMTLTAVAPDMIFNLTSTNPNKPTGLTPPGGE
jgi:hypothetical protein